MNPTDVRAVSVSYDGAIHEDDPFPSGGTRQVLGGSPVQAGRLKGWWILTYIDTAPAPDTGSCFIDLHDGTSVSDTLITRIGVGKSGVNGLFTGASYELPGNGLRFDNGIFLKCTPIRPDGTFYQVTFFYA